MGCSRSRSLRPEPRARRDACIAALASRGTRFRGPSTVRLVAGVAAPERRVGLGWTRTCSIPLRVAAAGDDDAPLRERPSAVRLAASRRSSTGTRTATGGAPDLTARARGLSPSPRLTAGSQTTLVQKSHTRASSSGSRGRLRADRPDPVATQFLQAEDPSARTLGVTWLAERYLPTARAWFPGEVNHRCRPLRTLGGARAYRSPWEKSYLDGLQKAYDLRGESVQAARVQRGSRSV